jgi:hypothetical protein
MLILVNVDDVPGELLPHVIDGLMARGAQNVHAVQSITKKGRLGYMIFIDTPSERLNELGAFLASEVGTIGMRVLESRHVRFAYRVRKMRLTAGDAAGEAEAVVRVKEVHDADDRVVSVKAEYEDLRSALDELDGLGVNTSLVALKRLVEEAALAQGQMVHSGIRIESVREVSP